MIFSKDVSTGPEQQNLTNKTCLITSTLKILKKELKPKKILLNFEKNFF